MTAMTIIGLIVILVVLGVVGWLINTYIPMSQGIKTVINVALIIIALLITLNAFGLLGSLNGPVPKLR